MKTIIAVIFLVFAIIIGMSTIDNYFNPSITNDNSSTLSLSDKEQTEEKFVVKLTGEVIKEGSYEVNENVYLMEAIQLAGGVTSNADESCFDYYLVIQKDMEIYIPPITDKEKISLNDASIDELVTLIGVGPTIGYLIISYRESNGGFKYLEELMEVDGIGEKIFKNNRDNICL